MKKLAFLFLLAISINGYCNSGWNLYLEQPNQKSILVNTFSYEGKKVSFSEKTDGFQVQFTAENKGDYWYYVAEAKALKGNKQCYLTLSKNYEEGQVPFGFFGEVPQTGVYRQSPHEPADHFFKDLLLNAVPLVAMKNKDGFEVAISNTPALFNNYTTQTFDLQHKEVKLSSGDNGNIFKDGSIVLNTDTIDRRKKELYRIEPFYFPISTRQSHRMDGIYFQTKASDLGKLREAINSKISTHWSKGTITDLLGATFFSTAYMNLRVNETGRSKFWVTPAIGYSNKQYSRDAFWISMALPKEYANYCYENEAASDKSFAGAERQLFTIVWAYRNFLNGMKVDTSRVRRILTIIEGQVKNGYYSGYSKKVRVEGCWQGQADLIAYEKDDALANNQGLFATALMCAEKMGIKPTVSIELARKNYENLFNPKIGALSMSLYKDSMLAADALMGDLLAQVYLKKPLLPTDKVLKHYETMKRFAKTQYGFKFFCNADGSYLKQNQYDSPTFKSAIDKVEDGHYQCGGSWYLYDMQLLMDAYLHGAKDAEDLMIWRTKLEYELGNSTHEFINTVTGKPHQPNMGWNAGVYGLWSEIMKQGKATNRFFAEIDKLK
jgi:hypothetical protein